MALTHTQLVEKWAPVLNNCTEEVAVVLMESVDTLVDEEVLSASINTPSHALASHIQTTTIKGKLTWH